MARRERKNKRPVPLSNAVECDDASVRAGHSGQPEMVQTTGSTGRRRRRKGTAGRGTWEKASPPGCGMRQRGGYVGRKLRAQVQPKAIAPCITATSAPGPLV